MEAEDDGVVIEDETGKEVKSGDENIEDPEIEAEIFVEELDADSVNVAEEETEELGISVDGTKRFDVGEFVIRLERNGRDGLGLGLEGTASELGAVMSPESEDIIVLDDVDLADVGVGI